VLDKSFPPETAELRTFLRKRLPEFMVPSAFVLLESMPMTPNGKLDRLHLPEATFTSPDGSDDNALERPADEIQSQLVKLWEELLGIRPIRIDENFFEIGGHSLMAVRMLYRIEQMFGKRLPVAM